MYLRREQSAVILFFTQNINMNSKTDLIIIVVFITIIYDYCVISNHLNTSNGINRKKI